MTNIAFIGSRSTSGKRLRHGAFIALRVLLGLAFIGASIFKLSGHPAVVAEFDQVGFGQGLRYVTALTEMTGAVLLLIPRTILFGAILMMAVCIGAFVAQLYALHGDVVHTVVLAATLGAIAWVYRDQLACAR